METQLSAALFAVDIRRWFAIGNPWLITALAASYLLAVVLTRFRMVHPPASAAFQSKLTELEAELTDDHHAARKLLEEAQRRAPDSARFSARHNSGWHLLHAAERSLVSSWSAERVAARAVVYKAKLRPIFWSKTRLPWSRRCTPSTPV